MFSIYDRFNRLVTEVTTKEELSEYQTHEDFSFVESNGHHSLPWTYQKDSAEKMNGVISYGNCSDIGSEKIKLTDFLKIIGIREDYPFSAALHNAGLLYTPEYPSGYGTTESTGWKEIKGKVFKAVLVWKSEYCEDGGIPCPASTKWKILSRA